MPWNMEGRLPRTGPGPSSPTHIFYGPLHSVHRPGISPEYQAPQPPAFWISPLDVHLPVQTGTHLHLQPPSSTTNSTTTMLHPGWDLGGPFTPPAPSHQPTCLHRRSHLSGHSHHWLSADHCRNLPTGSPHPHCPLHSILHWEPGSAYKISDHVILLLKTLKRFPWPQDKVHILSLPAGPLSPSPHQQHPTQPESSLY